MSEEVELLRKHVQYLGGLGTPDKIAEYLGSQGVKGIRVNAGYCVVANYLTQQTGSRCSTGTTKAGLRTSTELVTVPLPPQVTEFIHNFDGGLYPELEVDSDPYPVLELEA